MAQAPTEKKARKAPKKRPVFVGLQVLDESGQPMPISKDRVRLIICTRDAGSMLDILEAKSGENKYAFYKKVDAVE